MAKLNPIQPDPQVKTSDDIEASKILGVQSVPRSNPQKTTSNGNSSVGGKSVGGATRLRGGAF